jgi:glyoxylase-like metal-dependent hydrolase (beta-lactamase superfamily II)
VTQIGAARLTRIEESYEPNYDPHILLPDWRDDLIDPHLGWLVPDHFDMASGLIKLSIHSWLVEVGGLKVLIDTCMGNDKHRPDRPRYHLQHTTYLQRLAAAGIRPDQVDVVMCTHLHHDHVGWNTQLSDGRWVPTFPKARYLFSKKDYEASLVQELDPSKPPANHGSFIDSIAPVVDGGLADLVQTPYQLNENFLIEAGGGHTPGHLLIRMESQGREILFTGDILHHVMQILHPQWNSFVCWDPVLARATRRRVLEHCAGTGALLAPAHFGAPFACQIESRGEGFQPHFCQH